MRRLSTTIVAMLAGVMLATPVPAQQLSVQLPDSDAQEQSAPEALAEKQIPRPQHSGRGPVSELYVRLSSVGLDPKRVHRIRDAYIDREDLHIRLEDGIIAFSESVDGRVTAAFFEGEGEVLLRPPDRLEQWSMNVFTGSPILSERIITAFLRFNDDTLTELAPAFRPVGMEEAAAFIRKWDAATRQLASAGALRTATTILNGHTVQADGSVTDVRDPEDRFLLTRVFGQAFGVFDVLFDTTQAEQIIVGSPTRAEGSYDIWTSFPMRSVRQVRGTQTARETIVTQASAEAGIPAPFRIPSYKLNVRIIPPTTIEVDARLETVILSADQKVLRFELARDLQLSDVYSNGEPVAFLQNEAVQGSALSRRGNDVIAVVLPRAPVQGEKLSLRLLYKGDVLADAGGGLMYIGARGFWYPNRGLEMSDYDVEYRYPGSWTLASTGRRVSQSQVDGEVAARYVSDRPIPFAGFNLGKYTTASAKAGTVEIVTYAAPGLESNFPRKGTDVVLMPDPQAPGSNTQVPVLPSEPSPARNAQLIADRAARDIDFLSRRLGPFAYSGLSIAQMPGAMSQSWPGLIYLSTFVFLSPEERQSAKLSRSAELVFGHLMQTHETAHQWIGDLIIWESYREQWIVEALSNYCALLKLEAENPAIFKEILEHYRTELLAENENRVEFTDAGPVTLGVRLNSSRFPDAYNKISYGRGTWLFHMLRHLLIENPESRAANVRPGPDEPFFRVLRKMRQQFEGRSITTRDLQLLFEQELPDSISYEGKKSLDWFFDTWVNGTSVPSFGFADIRFTTAGGAPVVTGKIVQQHAPDVLVTSVPVYTAAGELLGRVFVEGPETRFRFRVPAGTRRITLDPYDTLLRRR